MKTTTSLYISGFIISALLLFGGYIITSFVVKTYTILQEENESINISIIAKKDSHADISRELMSQWLEAFTRRKYVSAIDTYTIHSINLEEEYGSHFIFSSNFSVITDNEDTDWKNWPHIQKGNQFIFDRKFRVSKVDDTYHFTTVTEATDVDFAK